MLASESWYIFIHPPDEAVLLDRFEELILNFESVRTNINPPLSFAALLEAFEKLILTIESCLTYILPPDFALLSEKIQETMIALELVKINTAPPLLVAEFRKKLHAFIITSEFALAYTAPPYCAHVSMEIYIGCNCIWRWKAQTRPIARTTLVFVKSTIRYRKITNTFHNN